MTVQSMSREAVIQLLMTHDIKRKEATKVFDAIFQLGFSAGRLEGHRDR
jgi:hypothetical protein